MKQRSNNSFNMEPPIKEGEVYTGVIDAVGEKGDGVLRIKGFVVFVPKVAKGDFIKVRITKVLQKVSFGELVEKLDTPPPEEQKFVKKEKVVSKEIAELLTTTGDSEDFGDSGDDDSEDDD